MADGSPDFEAAASQVEIFALPVIVLGEFRFGILRSRHRRRYERWLLELVAESQTLVIDEGTAVRYADLREHLRRIGRPIPSNDTWLAALALQHRLALLSRDAHFDAVPGLHRVGW